MGVYHYELATFVSKQAVVQSPQLQRLACDNHNFLFGTIQIMRDWRMGDSGSDIITETAWANCRDKWLFLAGIASAQQGKAPGTAAHWVPCLVRGNVPAMPACRRLATYIRKMQLWCLEVVVSVAVV